MNKRELLKKKGEREKEKIRKNEKKKELRKY